MNLLGCKLSGIEFPKIRYHSTCPNKDRCPVWTKFGRDVENSGDIRAPIVIVGEAPGAEEEAQGEAFVGRSGQLLRGAMREVGIREEDVYILNAVKCRPTNNETPPKEAVKMCSELYMWKEISAYPRKVILALGNIAVYALGLSKVPTGVSKLRGNLMTIKDREGRDIPVVISYHPAMILRNPSLRKFFISDLSKAKEVCEKGVSRVGEKNVILVDPAEDDASLKIDEFIEKAKRAGVFAYDLETTTSSLDFSIPFLASFAVRDGEEITVYAVWILDALIKKKNDKVRALFDKIRTLWDDPSVRIVAHNATFDHYRIQTLMSGGELPEKEDDTMLMYYLLHPGEDVGLKKIVGTVFGDYEYDRKMKEEVEERCKGGRRVFSGEHGSVIVNLWYSAVLSCGKRFHIDRFVYDEFLLSPHKEIPHDFGVFLFASKDTIIEYGTADAYYTLCLYEKLWKDLREAPQIKTYNEILKPLSFILAKTERRGMILDLERVRKLEAEIVPVMGVLEEELLDFMRKMLGKDKDETPNPRSVKQLIPVLYGREIKFKVYIPLGDTDEQTHNLKEVYKKMLRERIVEIKKENLNIYSDDAIRTRLESAAFDVFQHIKEKYGVNNYTIFEGNVTVGGLGYPVIEKTSTGQPSTSSITLAKLLRKRDTPFLKKLLLYRKLQKIYNTYIEPFLDLNTTAPSDYGKDLRLFHPKYNITRTATGRLSSGDTDPTGEKVGAFTRNVQNVPGSLRGIFVAPKGFVIVSSDLSQIELRVWAVLSRDAALIEALSASDVHRFIASKLFGIKEDEVTEEQRRKAKACSFALPYGASPYMISEMFGISKREAENLFAFYQRSFPRAWRFLDDLVLFARKPPHVLITPFGRRLFVLDILSSDEEIRMHAERQARNFIIQSTASDITQVINIRIHEAIRERKMEDGVFLYATVHDSLDYLVKEDYLDAFLEIQKECFSKGIPEMNGAAFPAKTKVSPIWGGSEPSIRGCLSSDSGLLSEYEAIVLRGLS